jgi:hypothetical protein
MQTSTSKRCSLAIVKVVVHTTTSSGQAGPQPTILPKPAESKSINSPLVNAVSSSLVIGPITALLQLLPPALLLLLLLLLP